MWIEIASAILSLTISTTSQPTRLCGLKFFGRNHNKRLLHVTAYAAVWIEIHCLLQLLQEFLVTAYAAVWIEINHRNKLTELYKVTAYAAVWIEISVLPQFIM